MAKTEKTSHDQANAWRGWSFNIFSINWILLRFYTGLLTDFTAKTYNIGVLKRKVQKINVKGDIENEKDY